MALFPTLNSKPSTSIPRMIAKRYARNQPLYRFRPNKRCELDLDDDQTSHNRGNSKQRSFRSLPLAQARSMTGWLPRLSGSRTFTELTLSPQEICLAHVSTCGFVPMSSKSRMAPGEHLKQGKARLLSALGVTADLLVPIRREPVWQHRTADDRPRCDVYALWARLFCDRWFLFGAYRHLAHRETRPHGQTALGHGGGLGRAGDPPGPDRTLATAGNTFRFFCYLAVTGKLGVNPPATSPGLQAPETRSL